MRHSGGSLLLLGFSVATGGHGDPPLHFLGKHWGGRGGAPPLGFGYEFLTMGSELFFGTHPSSYHKKNEGAENEDAAEGIEHFRTHTTGGGKLCAGVVSNFFCYGKR